MACLPDRSSFLLGFSAQGEWMEWPKMVGKSDEEIHSWKGRSTGEDSRTPSIRSCQRRCFRRASGRQILQNSKTERHKTTKNKQQKQQQQQHHDGDRKHATKTCFFFRIQGSIRFPYDILSFFCANDRKKLQEKNPGEPLIYPKLQGKRVFSWVFSWSFFL